MLRYQAAMVSALVFFFCGCGPRTPASRTMVLMGTYATVTVVPDTPEGRDAVDAIFELLRQREQQLNYYNEASELSRLNQAAHAGPVTVSEPLATLISRALAYSRMTDGAFDITATSLNQAQGFHTIQWDEQSRTVHITDDKARIDLGGITVGFVLDEAVALLRARGQENFMIDIGGDIYVAGLNPVGRPWRVGIRDPQQHNAVIESLALRDKAVTTSGNYVRPHIIDPASGQAAAGAVISVTVVAPRAIDVDALATAFFIMGIETTRAFLASRPDVQAIFVMQGKEKLEVMRIN